MNNYGYDPVYAEDPEDQIAEGIFEPTWQSLRSVQCPEWFRDAKLGFWAHWRTQAVPMYGDWYTRNMYLERLISIASTGGHMDIPPNLDSRTFAHYGRQRSSTPNRSAKTISYDCFTSGCTAIETHTRGEESFIIYLVTFCAQISMLFLSQFGFGSSRLGIDQKSAD